MNEADLTGKALSDELDALTHAQMRGMLAFLAGYTPKGFLHALDHEKEDRHGNS